MDAVYPAALHAPPPTNGPSTPFQIPWSSFVQVALEITVEAYQRMRQEGVARRDWEEDTFTAALTEDYLQPLARQHPLHLVVMLQTPVYTQAMKNGDVSPKQARRIDIKLFDPWTDYAKVYFAWECKRVGDKRMDRKYAVLISEYITEGMQRFLDGEYAAGLADAGMLGYVLAGEVSNIVCDINASMQHPRRDRPLSPSEQIELGPAIGTFTDAYQSHHESIHLYHLFLTFDFD